MCVYGGVEVQLHAFVTPVLEGCECQALYTWCIQVLRSPNFFFFSGMKVGRNVKIVGDGVAVL